MSWPVVLPAFIFSTLALLAGCSEKLPSDPRVEAPFVRVVQLQETNSASRSFSGVVAARVQSDLGFRVSGKVQERLVDTGQAVKKGQLLLRLDPVDLKLAAAAQEQAVAAARALAKQAADDEVRYRRLQGTGAISVSAYDQAKATADTAAANLSAAIAQAEVSRNATRYAELVADADGIVMETLAEPGQVISAGQAVIRLAHDGAREALLQLPETLRPTLGSAAQAKLFGKETTLIPAQLRQLSDATDSITRTFEARYVLQGDLAAVPLGATVTVEIADERLSAARHFSLPIAALFDAGEGPGVWVLRANKVAWHPVSVARLDDDQALITSDLNQGDQVIALGTHLLHEGMQVRVANSAAYAAEGAAL